MGCDIHCYIEYRKSAAESWRDFGGRINPGRDYVAFGFLAGVRTEGLPVVAPRGPQLDYAGAADQDYWCYVSDAESSEYVALKRAEEWVARGSSVWKNPNIKKCVSNPDWHSPSWMIPTEWKQAVELAKKETGWPMPEYDAITAALESLQRYGEARVVFWFDN